MPILGNPEGEPPQPGQQQVDQDHADTRRAASTQSEHEQEQVAIAQPSFGAAAIGCRGASLFYPVGRCDLGDLESSVFGCTNCRRSP